MYKKYKDVAEFFLVYIREAHPGSTLTVVRDGREVVETIEQTTTLLERSEQAAVCTASLHLSIPTLVDKEDNKVNAAYAGWPDRIAIIDAAGKIAYYGGPGPGGFKPNEAEDWLEKNVN